MSTRKFKNRLRESNLKQKNDFDFIHNSLMEKGKLDIHGVRKVVSLMLRRERFPLGANFIFYQLKRFIPCFACGNCCNRKKGIQ